MITKKPSDLIGKTIMDTYSGERYTIKWACFMNVGLKPERYNAIWTWNWQRVKRRFKLLKEDTNA